MKGTFNSISKSQGAQVQGSNKQSRRLLLCLTFGLVISAPTPAPAQSEDPWRSANETVFVFNDCFDQLLVRPVASIYGIFIPRFARQGIGNIFSNVDDINVFVNALLQMKFDSALSDSGRFLVNSTVGVVGIFDVATSLGLLKNEEDFGQTLGWWGVAPGPYIMLPVFGASNLRDSFGLILDTLFNPIQYQSDASIRFSLFLLEETDSRSSVLALDELITGNRYLFVREAYNQRREYLVKDGVIEDEFGAF